MDAAAKELKQMLISAFGEISDQLAKIDKRLGALEIRAEKMVEHLRIVSTRLDTVEDRLDGIDSRLAVLDVRAASSEARMDDLARHAENLSDDLRSFKNEVIGEFADLSSRTFARPVDREDLEVRVLYVENRLGIVSGK